MNRLKSLFYYIMQNPILFLIGLLFPPIVNLIIDVLAAYSTEIFINFSNDDNLGFSYIYSSMFLFILILIILTIVEDVARFIFDLFKKKTENNMKTDILSSIVKSKYKTFLAYGKGFIFNVYDGDTKSTVNVLSTDIFSIIYPIVMGIGYLVIIFTKNIFIGSLLFILCSIVILLNIFLTKKRVELQKKAKNINDDLISKMEELLQNKNNIRALAVTLPINKKMDKLSNKYLDVDRQNRFFSFLKISCIDTIIKICSILIAPFSCVLVSWGILPIASVALIIQLSRSFIPICSGIGSAFNNLKMDTVSVNRFMNIKDLQTEDYSVKTESLNNTKNLLIVNKAHALLNTNKKLVDISFNMEYGEIVAIVGPSGCGKSSFAKALMKILDYYGEIKLNGTDISELGISFVRDQISYVPEFNNIFEGTIRENLLWAKQDSTEDKLFKVIKAVALDCGLIDKNVGPRGEKLSGGQRQKIAIARALLKDSKLIILDEPTSALDNDSEASVLECISSIARTGKGIIIITHKESTASIANKIIRLI